MSVLKDIPDNVILFGTLSKTFGASGAVMVCRDKKIHQRIRNFGGPLTFSAQLEPASVGAAIASAKIHLSKEIYQMQAELQDRISFFNACLQQTDLPLIAVNDSPYSTLERVCRKPVTTWLTGLSGMGSMSIRGFFLQYRSKHRAQDHYF